MKTCPKCFAVNPLAATTCKQCGLPFDLTAVTFARNCPAGRHVMDPTWTICAFCKAEGRVGDDLSDNVDAGYEVHSGSAEPRKTQFEHGGRAGGGTQLEPWINPGGAPGNRGGQGSHSGTQFEGSAAGGDSASHMAGSRVSGQQVDHRKTRLDNAPPIPLRGGKADAAGQSAVKKTSFGMPGMQPGPADQRKIVGVLISYTWRPEGQIFPVREGRNWIGRDPLQADIVIEQDDALSAVNSTISFRTRFTIGDKDSMGGTYVNGEPVEDSSHPLPNYSRIRTGSTTWTFITIEPAAGEL